VISIMSHLFPPDRKLLYPQFETYRLHSLDPSTDLIAYSLPGSGATQARVGYNTHLLSFKETRARISWDHLATFGDRGVYIDVDWNIVGFLFHVSRIPCKRTRIDYRKNYIPPSQYWEVCLYPYLLPKVFDSRNIRLL
jgi:hypothetical protein